MTSGGAVGLTEPPFRDCGAIGPRRTRRPGEPGQGPCAVPGLFGSLDDQSDIAFARALGACAISLRHPACGSGCEAFAGGGECPGLRDSAQLAELAAQGVYSRGIGGAGSS